MWGEVLVKKEVSKNRLKPTLWFSLLKLSELGALHKMVKISTIEMARCMGFSQQTASRHMITLEKGGYIIKQSTIEGAYLRITKKGRSELESVFLQINKSILEQPQYITFVGRVVTGIDEGAYYVSRKKYREQFLRKLGFDPFPGTLNLKLNLGIRKKLETYPNIEIDGFMYGKRSFGKVKCFPAIINNTIKGAVALIDRTHHNDSVIEVIAPIYLRRKLGLKDGSEVQVKIKLNY